MERDRGTVERMETTSNHPSIAELACMIDHSLLHPTLTDSEIHAGLGIAVKWRCATACVKPYSVPMAAAALAGSSVKVCAVVGFPHGNSHPDLTALEAVRAIGEGAAEIDMVVNAGKVLGGDWRYVEESVGVVNQACLAGGAILKVIFENDYLPDEAIVRLCEICTSVRVAFVKTSSGYGFTKQASGNYNYQGATERHLRLMRKHCGADVQIKAAGGVRTLDDLLKVKALGATRVGATATEAMLTEAAKRGFRATSA